MTAPTLEDLATAVRFELVMRGIQPEPVFDQSAVDTVKVFLAPNIGDTYIRGRLTHVLKVMARPFRPSGWVGDVQIALGEYETFLVLQRRVGA